MTGPLMQAYYTLIKQTEIPDVEVYAAQLDELGKLFTDNARPSMAETCHAKAKQYHQLAKLIPAVRRVEVGKSFVMLEGYQADAIRPN